MIGNLLVCRCCGSHEVLTVGGEPGERSVKFVCADCGKTIFSEKDNRLSNMKLRIHIFGRGERCSLSSTIDLPICDGKYDLTKYDYPLCRYGEVDIDGINVSFDGEAVDMNTLPVTLNRRFPVTSAFRRSLTENHMITLSILD